MTTITPPPPPHDAAPQGAVPPSPEGRPRRSAPRVIAILTIVLGSAIILGTVVAAVFATLAVPFRQDHDASLDVSGVTELRVDADATDLTIEFKDVDEASLRVVEGSRGAWRFDVDDDTLRVASPPPPFFGWLLGGNGRATHTQPSELAGAHPPHSRSPGSLTADGIFGELELDLSAGDLDVTGEAETLDLDVRAGRADIDIADVREASFGLSAGDTTARLTGSAPRTVSVDVSAGSLDLTLPDETYALRSDVSAGGLSTGSLRTDGSSSRTVSIDLSAGSVTVRGAD